MIIQFDETLIVNTGQIGVCKRRVEKQAGDRDAHYWDVYMVGHPQVPCVRITDRHMQFMLARVGAPRCPDARPATAPERIAPEVTQQMVDGRGGQDVSSDDA